MNRRAFTLSLLAELALALGLVLFRAVSPAAAEGMRRARNPGHRGGDRPDRFLRRQWTSHAGPAEYRPWPGCGCPGQPLYRGLGNNRVRRVGVDGVISTIAGTGKEGTPAATTARPEEASLLDPDYVTFDPQATSSSTG